MTSSPGRVLRWRLRQPPPIGRHVKPLTSHVKDRPVRLAFAGPAVHTSDYGIPGGITGKRELPEPIEYPTLVATDRGDRNQIREELPLSTRVHELAKELGLKSAELLERIQGWGLDVKASNFASLDQPTVDRIRELSAGTTSSEAPVSARRCVAGAAGSFARAARPIELGGAARDQARRRGRGEPPTPSSPGPSRPELPRPSASGRPGACPGQQPVGSERPLDLGNFSGRRNRSGRGRTERRSAQRGAAGISAATAGSPRWLLERSRRRWSAFGAHSASRDRAATRLVATVTGGSTRGEARPDQALRRHLPELVGGLSSP